MKKHFVIGNFIFLIILTTILANTTIFYKTKIDNQEFKVYSFGVENKDIRISNGLILISPNKEIVNGGEILYTGSKYENIQSYSKTIYINKHGKKDTVLSNSVSYAGDNNGIEFPDEFSLNNSIGEISSEKLFSKDTLNSIKDNLYFSLDYLKVNGETGNFTAKLEVNEVSMNQTK